MEIIITSYQHLKIGLTSFVSWGTLQLSKWSYIFNFQTDEG